MKLSGIRYLYEARLGAKVVLVQEGFAIVGIAIGVALLFGSQIASTSLTRSVAQLNTQLVGSAQVQLQARGPEGFREGLLAEVRDVPGVQVALPVLERQVNVIGPTGERSVDLIGIDPNSVRASGPLLRRFSSGQLVTLRALALPDQIAREIGAGPLVPIKVQIGAQISETLVGATLQEADIGALVHSPIAVATIGYVQHLASAQGEISRIFVHYDPAQGAEVRAALGRLATGANVNLESGTFDTRLFRVAVAPESKSEELFSAISALVGFMFALNAMLITVPSRRKLIEDIRPHGATRWMTVQILLLDAAVIGVLACVLGLVLGDILSIGVFQSTPGYLSFAFPVGDARIVTWQSVEFAVASGMTAAVVGVLWPLRAILARPLQPRADSGEPHRQWTAVRLLMGGVCLALTTVTLFADTRAAIVGNVALVAALVCLLPFLFDVLVGLFAWASNVFDSVSTALAVTELQRPQTRVRSLAIAATAAVAVFGVVEFQGTQKNLERGLGSSIRGTDSTADLWVIPSGDSSIQPTTSFKAGNLAALFDIPGVSRVGVYRGSFLDWGERRLWIIGPAGDVQQPVPAEEVQTGNAKLASREVSEGGWAVLSQALAAEHQLHVGQEFTLPSPRPLRLRVAALTTNLGWPPGAIILSAADYGKGWQGSDPSAYEIQTTPGAPIDSVRNAVRVALISQHGLAVESSGEREQRHYAAAAQGLSRLTQVRMLVLIAAILAIVGAMGSMIWQRRGRVAYSKCHGYLEGVLWRALLCESALVLIAGCLIGAVFGIYAQLLGSHFLASVTGFPIAFDIEATAAISSFVVINGIALAMLAVPGYFAVRVAPSTVNPPD